MFTLKNPDNFQEPEVFGRQDRILHGGGGGGNLKNLLTRTALLSIHSSKLK